MAGNEAVARWIAEKSSGEHFKINLIGAGFLQIVREEHPPFIVAAIGVQDRVTKDEVAPLFGVNDRRPEFVVNVPSKAIWTGAAIDFIHNVPAAFGTLGDMNRAASEEIVSEYRNKEYRFFERAFEQHRAVGSITRVYDKVFQLHRHHGLRDITVALVDAYDVSAENIRNARALYGEFDAAVKTTSYGSITTAAHEAAKSMNAEVFGFGDLLARLHRP